ncbi:hypothetical protein FOL47_011227 [Perkinsus chesapeaki]|uniref:Uncharacterized protein n=1 Tax=Perkinsus chesapeaki TaxID=330153 RepID=A0A7J6KYI7_PERCH|nr:hypothetical protein FOL47_011227 [Perkinsus chesapeaki]
MSPTSSVNGHDASGEGGVGQQLGDSGRIIPDAPPPTLSQLKAARTAARCKRTKLSNRLERVKKAIEEYVNDDDDENADDDYNLEDDPDYNSLLAEEDQLENQLSDATVAVAAAERAVEERLHSDTAKLLPPPTPQSPVGNQLPPVADPINDEVPLEGSGVRHSGPSLTDAGSESTTAIKSTSSRAKGLVPLGKILVPTLLDAFAFPQHLELICTIFAGHGYGTFQNGIFEPLVQETELVLKFLGSVEKCNEVHRLAVSMATSCKHKWSTVITTLSRTFSKKTTLRTEVSKRLKALRFTSVEMVEAFNQQIIAISNLWSSVFANEPAEFRGLVQKFLSKLPTDFLKAVTTQILANLPPEFAYCWEDHILLHEDAAPALCTPSVCLTTTLSHVARSFEISESLQGQNGRRQDHVRRVRDDDFRLLLDAKV